jgi:hypothetical protein
MAIAVERDRAASLCRLGVDARLIDQADGLLATLGEHHRGEFSAAEHEGTLGVEPTDEPRRIVDGPLVYSVTDRLDDDEREFFKERLSANHRALAEGLLNLCDGARSPREIALRLSLDVGSPVSEETAEGGIALLRKVGYVS